MFAMDDGNYKKKWQIETFALHIKNQKFGTDGIFVAIQVGLPWSDSTMPQIYKWFSQVQILTKRWGHLLPSGYD